MIIQNFITCYNKLTFFPHKDIQQFYDFTEFFQRFRARHISARKNLVKARHHNYNHQKVPPRTMLWFQKSFQFKKYISDETLWQYHNLKGPKKLENNFPKKEKEIQNSFQIRRLRGKFQWWKKKILANKFGKEKKRAIINRSPKGGLFQIGKWQ